MQRVQCGLHNYPIQYLCIDQICQHQFRGLCMLCFNGDQIDDHYDLNNIVAFLIAEQKLRISRIRRFKIKLMYFLTCVLKINVEAIQEQIMAGDEQLEGVFQRQDNVNWLYQLCQQKRFTQESISELGMCISRFIGIGNNNQQYKLLIPEPKLWHHYQEIKQRILKHIIKVKPNRIPVTQFTIRSWLLKRKWEVKTKEIINNQVIKRKPLYQLTQRIELGRRNLVLKLSSDESQIVTGSYSRVFLFDLIKNKVQQSSQAILLTKEKIVTQLCFNKQCTLLVLVCSKRYVIIYSNNCITRKWRMQSVLRLNLYPQIDHATFSDDSRTLAIAGKLTTRILIFSYSKGNWRIQRALLKHVRLLKIYYTANQKQFVAVAVNYIAIYSSKYERIHFYNMQEIVLLNPFISYQINTELNTIVQEFYEDKIQVLKLNNLTNQWSRQMLSSNHRTNINKNLLFNSDYDMFLSRSNDLLSIWKYDSLLGKWKLYQNIKQVGEESQDMVISKDSTTIYTMFLSGIISVYTLSNQQ